MKDHDTIIKCVGLGLSHLVPVWIQRFPLNPGLRFLIFFFFFPAALFDQVNREQCTCALFTDPQIPLFSNFFIKNGSHDTIHTFKNYFVTVFSVSVFSFSKNKLNPNGPLVKYPYLGTIRTRHANTNPTR